MSRKHSNVQLKSKESSHLRKQLKYLNFEPTSENISWIWADHVSLVLDRAAITFFNDGITAWDYYNYPIELLRIHTACIYSSACCESGPETKKVIAFHKGELAKAIDKMQDRVKVIAQDNRIQLSTSRIEDILNRVNRVRSVAGDYVIAMDRGDSKSAREAKQLLREIAADHEEIFNTLKKTILKANKRGAKKNEALTYIGRLATKYKSGSGWQTGEIVYERLCLIDEDERLETQSQAIDHLSKYFEEGSFHVRETDKNALNELINREIRKHKKRHNN